MIVDLNGNFALQLIRAVLFTNIVLKKNILINIVCKKIKHAHVNRNLYCSTVAHWFRNIFMDFYPENFTELVI